MWCGSPEQDAKSSGINIDPKRVLKFYFFFFYVWASKNVIKPKMMEFGLSFPTGTRPKVPGGAKICFCHTLRLPRWIPAELKDVHSCVPWENSCAHAPQKIFQCWITLGFGWYFGFFLTHKIIYITFYIKKSMIYNCVHIICILCICMYVYIYTIIFLFLFIFI